MEHHAEKNKRPISLLTFLECKKIDKERMRQFYVENCPNIPQELRLILWKICLGISGLFQDQYNATDKSLNEQYQYLQHVLENVIVMKRQLPAEMNFCLYLLDRGELPTRESDIDFNHPFLSIYKQMTEILDDQTECETYFLSAEFSEYLKSSLDKMKSSFEATLSPETQNLQTIKHLDVDVLLLSGLAGLFKDITMYHIIWDRVIMGDCDLLVFTLLSYLEHCRDEQLNLFKQISSSEDYTKLVKQIKTIGVDESKVLKRSIKYYKSARPSLNPAVFGMIQNFFNSK